MRALFISPVLALALLPALRADRITFVGVNGHTTNDGYGSFYVSPYSGTLNDGSLTLYCDDIFDEVRFGDQWDGYVTRLSGNPDLSNTKFGSMSGALQKYQQVAWLDSQYFKTDPAEWAAIQETVWSIFDPNDTRLNPSAYWLSQAEKNSPYAGVSDWVVLTDSRVHGKGVMEQEFLANATPEPAMLLPIGVALIGLSFLRKGRRAAAPPRP